MAAIFLTGDLMIASSVTGVADRADVDLRVVGSTDDVIASCQCEDQDANTPISLVIVDLGVPNLELGNLIAAIEKNSSTRPTIVAFGPHVHALRLDAARQVGCDEVMSRGQFHTAAEDVLRWFG